MLFKVFLIYHHFYVTSLIACPLDALWNKWTKKRYNKTTALSGWSNNKHVKKVMYW